MIRAQPLVFAGASAATDAFPDYYTQRMLNVYAIDTPPSDYGQVLYKGAAGLREVVNLGQPIRAMGEFGGMLYAAANNRLWQISATGGAVPLANVPDDPVMMMDGNGDTVLITSTTGVTAYAPGTGTVSGVTGLAQASSVAYIDNFAIFTEPNSGRIWVSDVGDLDNVDGLSFATAETDEDDVVRVFVDHREIWVFGRDTVEIWYVSGGADLPIARANEASMEKGCAAALSVQKVSNTVFWLGSDRVVYGADGYAPKMVSNEALNVILAGMTPQELEDVTSMTWSEEGREMYALNLPGRAAWVLDTANGSWWERGTPEGPWRGTCSAKAYLNDYIGGSDGRIYQVDLNHFTDGDDPILREMISGPVGDGSRRLQHRYLRADMGRSTGGLSVSLDVSDEGDAFRPLGGRVISDDQSRKRTQWNNLGQSRWRTYRLRCFSTQRFYMRGCLAGIVPGRD